MSLQVTATGARAASKLRNLVGRMYGDAKCTAVATRRATARRRGADDLTSGKGYEKWRPLPPPCSSPFAVSVLATGQEWQGAPVIIPNRIGEAVQEI